MSFYSYKNEGNPRCPGRIGFEGLRGVTERVCIQVNKVYDSCLQQETLEDVVLKLKDICRGDFDRPFEIISCRSKDIKGELVGTRIDRLEDRPNFARVRTTVKIPLEVVFEDSKGREGTGIAILSIPKDVIMYVPNESVIPFNLESVVNAFCVSGTFNPGDNLRFDVDICVTIILKIVAKVELLVPAFGFCEIPPCEEFAENICEEFFARPLFPPQMEDVLGEEEERCRHRSKCDDD